MKSLDVLVDSYAGKHFVWGHADGRRFGVAKRNAALTAAGETAWALGDRIDRILAHARERGDEELARLVEGDVRSCGDESQHRGHYHGDESDPIFCRGVSADDR